ncbi:hypothetical protein L209DRAFT_336212 [Thermothelomyces heterothallicus CBS 203.75]
MVSTFGDRLGPQHGRFLFRPVAPPRTGSTINSSSGDCITRCNVNLYCLRFGVSKERSLTVAKCRELNPSWHEYPPTWRRVHRASWALTTPHSPESAIARHLGTTDVLSDLSCSRACVRVPATPSFLAALGRTYFKLQIPVHYTSPGAQRERDRRSGGRGEPGSSRQTLTRSSALTRVEE